MSNIGDIAAGIVLFNPDDMERVEKCIDSVARQVKHIYIFDNSTEDINLKYDNNITYLSKKKNKGIAYALNRIMENAKKDGYSWVLTMDQDSILPFGMIEDFLNYTDQKNIGIICPQVIDKRRAYMKAEDSIGTEYLDMCITSASCTSVKAWENIGGFDEWLFIDLVDNEFCKRLVVSGYKILQVKKWILDQEFGKISPKSPKKQKFWISLSKILHNPNIAKFSYKKSVSTLRVYYTCRNIVYVNRKLKKYGKTAYENYNCKGYAGFWISFVIPSILRGKNKIKIFNAVVKGTFAGLTKKVICW